jgi:hypothetical protein
MYVGGLCGDEDGCRLLITLNKRPSAIDEVKVVEAYIWMEKDSGQFPGRIDRSRDNSNGVAGYTIQTDGPSRSWQSGGGFGNRVKENMLMVNNWVRIVDYEYPNGCGGRDITFTHPYTFDFVAEPGIAASITVYDY